MTPEQLSQLAMRIAREVVPPAEMRRIAELAVIEYKKGFVKGVGPDGVRWPALKPATVRRKRGEHATQKTKHDQKTKTSAVKRVAAKASAHPESPLRDTDTLMTPMIEAEPNAARIIMARSRSEKLKCGASISEIHQKGLGNNPVRLHWGISEAAERKARKYYAMYVSRMVMRMMRGG